MLAQAPPPVKPQARMSQAIKGIGGFSDDFPFRRGRELSRRTPIDSPRWLLSVKTLQSH